MYILTCEQMKNAESDGCKNGLSYLQMMENAGVGCYEKIREIMNPEAKKVCVVCGKGNNGGDGFVIAGELLQDGFDVTVLLSFGEPKSDTADYFYQKLKKANCRIIDLTEDETTLFSSLDNADIIIDAVFGTGFSGKVEGKTQKLFETINRSHAAVFSVDVPSGISGDSSEAQFSAVRSDHTLAVCAFKPCHVFYPARENCGETVCVEIGIDDETIKKNQNLSYYSLTKEEISRKFKRRNPVSNKGDFGKVLEVCGSKRMPGAAVLCGKGILRAGAGLLKIAFPDSAYSAVAPSLTEAIMNPLASDDDGFFDKRALPEILRTTDWADVVVIGCGLGLTEATSGIVREVIRNSKAPIVIDADGINVVAKNISILREAKAPIILTPHPGEMSRLTGMSISVIQSDRIKTVRKFASENNVTVVLKGANTVVGSPDASDVFVNTTGNAGMATGGSGDLLAGMIAGFLAQRMSCIDAAVCGTFVHGMAGDLASAEKSKMSALPSDVAEKIPNVLLAMEENL